MKKVSLVLMMLILTFGLVNAQQVSLESVTGKWPSAPTSDHLDTGSVVSFFIRFDNPTANVYNGTTNGFQIYATDEIEPAEWDKQ